MLAPLAFYLTRSQLSWGVIPLRFHLPALTILTVSQICSKLEAGEAVALVGAIETVSVDFKAEPYLLQSARQRQELAKDLSALANAGGGLIVIGFKTEKEAGRATDVVLEPRPFPATMFNEEQWRKVAADWIYPPIGNLAFSWYDSENGKGFLTIEVPDQQRSVRPFLVKRTAWEGEQLDGAIFGMFERRHADSSPVTAEEVQALMRDGLLFRAAIDSRSALADDTRQSPDTSGPLIPPESIEATLTRAARLIEIMHLGDRPTYILTATPHPHLPGRKMFEAADNAIVRLLNKPPEVRASGFDMDTGFNADIVSGESRRSFVDGYKGKEFWTDGTLIFVATGDEDFLSWGNRQQNTPLVVNQVTLLESILLFCCLAAQLYTALGTAPTRIEFAIRLARMCSNGQRPALTPGPLQSPRSLFDAKEAPGCDLYQRETVTHPFDPDRVAFLLASRVYEWFGFEHENIPYVATDKDPRINADAIARI